MTNIRLHIGNCLEVLRGYPDNSFDSIVTDPPYGISFMSRKWDYDVPSVEVWAEILRVLKPGGYLASFSSTRTYHRIACAIEDAGFEIRDKIDWVYGSGMPKSKQISVAIDNHFGLEREVIGTKKGVGGENLNDIVNGRDVRQTTDEGAKGIGAYGVGAKQTSIDIPITKPNHSLAEKYDGFGTGLKPSIEPICIARKPLIGTLAENYIQHGTGGINIDGCRVPGEAVPINRFTDGAKPFGGGAGHEYESFQSTQGRWPANICHDNSPEVLNIFPQAPGQQGKVSGNEPSTPTSVVYGETQRVPSAEPRNDSGSAARYFNSFPFTEEDAQSLYYCAKAARKEREAGLESLPARTGAEAVMREEGSKGVANPRAGAGRTAKEVHNHHPTVKPIALMRWLCRLITPPGGVILDPFMGSGSTGVAAIEEGFGFVGIDMDPEYVTIAQHRIARVVK